MNKRDYYDILGLPKDATSDSVKKAYRKMAMQFHPDRNPGDKAAEEKFKEASEAYSVLIDPEKRSLYDRYGHDGLRGESFSEFNSSIFGDFEDILGNFFNFGFGDIFGSSRARPAYRPQRGDDLALEMQISMEEAFKGVEKEIKLNRAEMCSPCDGSGMTPGTSKSSCPACKGQGQIRYQQGFFTIARECSRCHGAREIIESPCKTCHGTGKTRAKGTLKIKIPAGIDNGNRLRIEGGGEVGDKGAPRGDLYVVIRIAEHEFFKREENHLHCEIPLSITQAALGAVFEIPTLDEESEMLKIPPGTQSGDLFKIKGKGFKDVHRFRRGDLFVKVVVKTPENLSKKERDILREFAKMRGDNIDSLDTSVADAVHKNIH